VKFDKDIMALLKATKKGAKTPVAAIAERRKPTHDDGPPNECLVPDQNIEPPSNNLRTKRRDLHLPPVTEKWSADGTL
jgi:hypothetical protein